MSYDESDDDTPGEWEVVDIIETSTSVNPSKKPKAAKQEDVDKLAADMQAQLSFKSTQLEEKLRHQERLSQQQMAEIQSKLSQISRIQTQQEKQQKDLDQQRQQMLLEQRIKIESLSELTQKQIADAQEKIQRTQQATQNVTENVQTLQQLQQLNQLAQLQQLNQAQVAQPSFNNMTIPPLQPQPPVHGTIQAQPDHNQHNALYGNPISNADHHPLNGNGTLNNNSNSNGWLPSFFVFGNKGSNATNTSTDLHMTSSPNISTTVTTNINHGNMNSNHCQSLHAAEEKANILGDEDDDEVLEWNNEYGHNASSSAMHSPLNSQLTLLKTKCVIGEGKFRPSEERQCGWILQNKSRSLMKMTAKLECIGGDEDGFGIRVSTEKEYEFTLKPEEEVFILIEVKAPGIVGRYCSFYQLVMENGVKVGDTLEVLCEVEAQFNKSKEDKIASLIKMGFDDRKKVVQVLEKKKWNVQQSVDVLIAM